MPQETYTREAWWAEGERRFGPNMAEWRFVCPACGHVASVADWKNAGASSGEIAFSCIGRRLPECRDAFGDGPGPCNYAGGGLFRLNPVKVISAMNGHENEVFAFADRGAS